MSKFLGAFLAVAFVLLIYAVIVAASGAFIYFAWNIFLSSLFDNRMLTFKEGIGISILLSVISDLIRRAIPTKAEKK